MSGPYISSNLDYYLVWFRLDYRSNLFGESNVNSVADFVGAFASTSDGDASQLGHSDEGDFGIKDDTENI